MVCLEAERSTVIANVKHLGPISRFHINKKCLKGQGHSRGSYYNQIWLFLSSMRAHNYNQNMIVFFLLWGLIIIIKIWLFLLHLLSCWLFCNQTCLMVHHHKLECLEKRLGYCVQGQMVVWNLIQHLLIIYFVYHWYLCNQLGCID